MVGTTMAIYNLGSINRDLIYQVGHLPEAGETLIADNLFRTLGGKGLNQSVAAVRAGAEVVHIGAVGQDDNAIMAELTDLGMNTDAIACTDQPTGHATINVDRDGENAIVLLQGANINHSKDAIASALSQISHADILLLQNETNGQQFAAMLAQKKSATVIYSAAPFDAKAVQRVIDHVSILVMNAVEADQLKAALDIDLADLPVSTVIITKGANGADWLDVASGDVIHCPAHPAEAIDTTGAGDTFIGYVAAALSVGHSPQKAMQFGSFAAALMVSRQGTAAVIPTKSEVDALY
jgi:ribokinase